MVNIVLIAAVIVAPFIYEVYHPSFNDDLIVFGCLVGIAMITDWYHLYLATSIRQSLKYFLIFVAIAATAVLFIWLLSPFVENPWFGLVGFLRLPFEVAAFLGLMAVGMLVNVLRLSVFRLIDIELPLTKSAV